MLTSDGNNDLVSGTFTITIDGKTAREGRIQYIALDKLHSFMVRKSEDIEDNICNLVNSLDEAVNVELVELTEQEEGHKPRASFPT